MHKVKVNRLVKLAYEKNVVRLADCLIMTIAVDFDVKQQTPKKALNFTQTCLNEIELC